MTPSTQKLTRRAADQLGEDVTIAVRVRQDPNDRYKGTASEHDTAGFPVMGLPVLPLLRSVKHAVTDVLFESDALKGILAFTRSGDRIAMGRDRFRSRRPTDSIVCLPRDVPATVHMARLGTELIPELTVDNEHFVINSVDFGALTRAIVNGEVDEPVLAEQLGPWHEHSKAVAAAEPETIRKMLAQ